MDAPLACLINLFRRDQNRDARLDRSGGLGIQRSGSDPRRRQRRASRWGPALSSGLVSRDCAGFARGRRFRAGAGEIAMAKLVPGGFVAPPIRFSPNSLGPRRPRLIPAMDFHS